MDSGKAEETIRAKVKTIAKAYEQYQEMGKKLDTWENFLNTLDTGEKIIDLDKELNRQKKTFDVLKNKFEAVKGSIPEKSETESRGERGEGELAAIRAEAEKEEAEIEKKIRGLARHFNEAIMKGLNNELNEINKRFEEMKSKGEIDANELTQINNIIGRKNVEIDEAIKNSDSILNNSTPDEALLLEVNKIKKTQDEINKSATGILNTVDRETRKNKEIHSMKSRLDIIESDIKIIALSIPKQQHDSIDFLNSIERAGKIQREVGALSTLLDQATSSGIKFQEKVSKLDKKVSALTNSAENIKAGRFALVEDEKFQTIKDIADKFFDEKIASRQSSTKYSQMKGASVSNFTRELREANNLADLLAIVSPTYGKMNGSIADTRNKLAENTSTGFAKDNKLHERVTRFFGGKAYQSTTDKLLDELEKKVLAAIKKEYKVDSIPTPTAVTALHKTPTSNNKS